MKRRIRLSESELRKVIGRSVRKALNEGEWDDIDFSRTRGVRLPDGGDDWCLSPREIKTKIQALQDALKDVMDMTNGNRAGDELSNELFDGCYKFYNFISQYMVELVSHCRDINGSWDEDKSDMPFIRKYDDNSTVQSYYDKQGNALGRERFGSNYKPHQGRGNGLNETMDVPSGDGLPDRTEELRDRVRGNSKKFAKGMAKAAYDMYPYQEARKEHEAERDEQRYKRSLERPEELSKEDMDEILRTLDALPADL